MCLLAHTETQIQTTHTYPLENLFGRCTMTVLPAGHSVSWCWLRGKKGGGQGILCNLYNKFFGNWALMTGCENPSILEIFRTSRKFCSRMGLSYFKYFLILLNIQDAFMFLLKSKTKQSMAYISTSWRVKPSSFQRLKWWRIKWCSGKRWIMNPNYLSL